MADFFNSTANGTSTDTECPTDYIRYKEACYYFSSYSSYDDAKKSCESVGARLADIEATHGKFVLDKVKPMDGNNFWIGSFRHGGRVLRQTRRNLCPVLKDQRGDDALYGMVECNSSYRFVCQKFGPDNEANSIDTRLKIMSTTPGVTTTTGKVEGTGEMSLAIYVVILVIVLITAMITMKLITKKYFQDTKKDLKPTNSKNGSDFEKNLGNGIVVTLRRKGGVSKRTSLDSGVNPNMTKEAHKGRDLKGEEAPKNEDSNHERS